nr:ribonuclease H-like domain-containing protein [Tanacetum cinerariifolium]
MYTVNGLDTRFATLVDIIRHRKTLPLFETTGNMLLLKESSFKDDTRTSNTFDGSSSSLTALVTSTSSTPKGLFLSQKKYACELLEHANMVNCNPLRTPVDTDSKLGPEGVAVQDPIFVSTCMTHGSLTLLPLNVSCGDNLLSWSSKRQHTISRSSAEAKYRGVANVFAETAWLRNLLRELHSPLSIATLDFEELPFGVEDVDITRAAREEELPSNVLEVRVSSLKDDSLSWSMLRVVSNEGRVSRCRIMSTRVAKRVSSPLMVYMTRNLVGYAKRNAFIGVRWWLGVEHHQQPWQPVGRRRRISREA